MGMDTKYDFKKYEDLIYNTWEKSNAFKPSGGAGTPFTIIMPPPNANDPLHVGHAMFVAIEDILTRYHRMTGVPTLWLPGTDHAGIETQFVFEKKLAKKDQSRFDFDRDTLYKMIWEYVKDNSNLVINQMKKLGASADWSRFKFTLDPDVVKIVLETFVKLDKDNLIYRGEKLVNYCTKCGTGYSELEVEHVEKISPLYYIKYFYQNNPKKYLTVATTRPEPIYIDTHLAINPKNKKTKHLKNVEVLNPLTGVVMKIIEDSFVDPEFGTGVVKLTPAHDQIDFEVAKKHNLPIIKAVNTYGKMIGGPSDGKKVLIAREEAIKLLTTSGNIEKIDNKYTNRVATCYRCHSILEPIPLTQFFISIKPLVKEVIKSLDSKETAIIGAGQEKILKHWLNNLNDWNISRRIVWGIRIPVWYSASENKNLQITFINKDGIKNTGCLIDYDFKEVEKGLQSIEASKDAKYVVSIIKPQGDYIQETDTFDTWFSSGQWPIITLMTNEKEDFNKFYPTSVMNTGYDILPFWIMRMMILGIYLTKKSPFKTVYLHGLVRDEKGRKMSKSIGNTINPLEIVEKYGADALRFALVMSSTPAQDKSVGENAFKGMRNFSNKIWNAGRFVRDFNNNAPDNLMFNKWYRETFPRKITGLLDKCKIGLAAEELYNDFWHNFCDIQIEKAKKDELSSSQLKEAFIVLLKLLHPFMPFVTEAVWKEVGNEDLLITSKWPNMNNGQKKS